MIKKKTYWKVKRTLIEINMAGFETQKGKNK